MKGYKAFNSDLTCQGFQFEIGKTYEYHGYIVPCKSGFHFCKSIADCYQFYEMSDKTRICKVKATGNIMTNDDIKYCTDKITILSEVKNPRLKSNLSDSNSGYCNLGRHNSGSYNSGDSNSGNCNSGCYNMENFNSGDNNSGYCNTGNFNSGQWNSGYRNMGNYNTGDWNSGNYNSGIFNTEKSPKIKIFDKESDWTIDDWFRSDAIKIMEHCPCLRSCFIPEENMTNAEKESHPDYRTIGGFVKIFKVTENDRQLWWNSLTEEEKQIVKELPNFDANKFKECTGIMV